MLRINYLLVIFWVIHLCNQQVFADEPAMLKCKPPVMQNVQIKFPPGVKFSTYAKGGEAKFGWTMPAYSGQVDCERVGSATGSPAYSWVTPVLPTSEINPGFYKLNNDLDISLSFLANGQAFVMPLDDVWTGQFTVYPVDKTYWRGYFPLLSAGYVTLKLRRDIIGGAIFFPANKLIAPLDMNSHFFQILTVDRMHLLNFVTEQEIIPVPSRCFINNGQMIDINLGDINSDWLAASSNKKVIVNTPLNVRCDGPLDSQDFSATVTLLGDPANFTYQGAQLLQSSQPNVGVFLTLNDRPLSPWQAAEFMMYRGGTRLVLSAMPLKAANSQPTTGAFSANATLVLSLP